MTVARHWGWFALVIMVTLAMASFTAPAAAKRVYTGIVVDQQTGQTLYQHKADRQIHPASLTKMMTLYMLFDAMRQGKLDMDSPLRVSRNAAGKPASKLGLRNGTTILARDAIKALIVKSANDVATVVAEALAPSEVVFARRMTAMARKLGLVSTSFRNANGLPNRRQVSTARDMANLAIALQRDFPELFPLFATRTFAWKGRKYGSTNRLLGRTRGVDGIKTGYINASGFNLVTTVERGGRRLVAVVIGGRTAKRRDTQMQRLIDMGFRRATERAAQGQLRIAANLPPVKPGTTGKPSVLASLRNLNLIAEANAATAPTEAVAMPIGDHGIQVGAFGSTARADTAIRQAVAAAPDLLRNRPIDVNKVNTRKGKLYRARLLAFNASDARAACRALKDRRVDCLVIRTGQGS
ncbi:MAG: D-alanyl-D-alanine carboxypeptidase [Minwuia sp.]|nr:D-alanyl-D-alanine carboxypeptidase [Minwuia sp.]